MPDNFLTSDERKENLSSLLERINTFLFAEEQLDEKTLTEDMNRVAKETKLSAEQVESVVESVLTILEERREERGIYPGNAFPTYGLRTHARQHQYFGMGWARWIRRK